MQIPNLKTQDILDKLKSAFMEDSNANNPGKEATGQQTRALQTTPKPNTSQSVFAAVLNGLGVGLLLGMLLGLAVSPVVSGVIGTLSSILVVLLGLNDKHITTLKSLRIGSFGVFAVAGIILGIYIRANDALSSKTTDLKHEYVEAGYSEDQALYYVALKKFDYVPVGWFGTSEKDTVAMSKTDQSDKSVLFSSEMDLDVCENLNVADNTFPREEIYYTFEDAGGMWKELASAMPEDLPDQVYVDGMLGIRDSFCAYGNKGKVTIEGSKKLAALTPQNSAEEITNALNKAGGAWESILKNTEKKIPDEYRVSFYLTIIKVLNDEESN